MANTFLKAEKIMATAMALLQREIVLPRLVWRFGVADFAGAKNDTVTVRVPAVLAAREYEWRTRTSPIVIDDIVEKSVAVTLDKHPYSAVAVTDEQLTLDITSFAGQILRPQVRAVAEKLEDYVAAAFAAAPIPADGSQTITFDPTPATTEDEAYRVAVEARRILNIHNVPMSDRYLLLGPNLEGLFLRSAKLSDVDRSGSSTALRDATIGRLAGFSNIVVSNAIDPNTGYAFHKSAVAFGNVAPVVPDGAVKGSSQSSDGLSMTWIQDYDMNFLRDRSVVSSFAGAASVNEGMGDTGDVDTDPDDPINVRLVKIVTGS